MGKKKRKQRQESNSQPIVSHTRKFISRNVLNGALLIVAVTFFSYANGLGGPFIFDDETNIVHNGSIHHLSSIRDTFNAPAVTSFSGRPLVNFTFALNYAIGGENVWGYHAVNILIHALAALVLFGIVRRTLMGEPLRERFGSAAVGLALACALVWAIHPLQTQSVTYITQRCESLMGLFFFLTLYCAIRGWQDSSSRWWHLAAIVACLFGVGSKETIVAAPFMVLIYDVLFNKRKVIEALKQSKSLYAGFGICLAALGLLVAGEGTLSGVGRPPFTIVEYARSQPVVIFHYLRLAFWPDSLCLDYGWPVVAWKAAFPYTVGLLLLFGLSVWALWKRFPIGFAAIWFFATLAPTSSFWPLRDLAFEYRMYLPLAGLAVIVVAAGYEIIRNIVAALNPSEESRRNILVRASGVVLATIAVTLSALTSMRNADYHSGFSIWNDTVSKRPDNPRAHSNLGYAVLQSGTPTDAFPYMQKAIELDPQNARALNNMGLALGKAGRGQNAVPYLEEAVRLEPGNTDYNYNLGFAYSQIGKNEEALPYLKKTIEVKQDDPQALGLLGHALVQTNRANEAVSYLRSAVKMKLDFIEAMNDLGYAMITMGESKAAIPLIQKTLSLDEKNAKAHFNIGYAYFFLKDYQKALDSFRKSLQIDPDDPIVLNNLGKMLIQTDRSEEAIPYFEKAVRLKPDYAEAYNYYGMALSKAGRVLEGIDCLKEAVRIKPDYIEAHENLGLAYGFARKTQESIPEFVAALELDPNYAEAHFNLGVALSKLGRLDQAISHFQTAVSLKPGFTAAKENLDSLKEQIKNIEKEEQLEKERQETLWNGGGDIN